MQKDRVLISLCTTCRGRRHHLEKTLCLNLDVARRLGAAAQIVLLNYNSPDGLDAWISDNFRREIEEGLLDYFRTDSPEFFRVAHAKNVAARIAAGEIVVCLDADNFISADFLEGVVRAFSEDPMSVVCAAPGLGHGGRIAVRRDQFFRLGGFQEDFEVWGREDKEFLFRAIVMARLKHVSVPELMEPIWHDETERLSGYNPASLPREFDLGRHDALMEDYRRLVAAWAAGVSVPGFLSAEETAARHRGLLETHPSLAPFLQMNLELTLALMERGTRTANQGHSWGEATLIRNFIETVRSGGPMAIGRGPSR